MVILGGSFFALGNVNPAAEANVSDRFLHFQSFLYFNYQISYNLGLDGLSLQIHGDPEAADIVFTSRANIVVVGLNITRQVKFTGGIVTLLFFNFPFIFFCSKLLSARTRK